MGIDPDNPRAVALAACCRTQLVLYDGTDHPEAERTRARQLADRAAALDPLGDPLVLTARSGGAMAVRRCDEVGALLARAGAIAPDSGWVWERKGWLRAIHGEAEPALACFRRAMQLKGPRAPIANCLAGIGDARCDDTQSRLFKGLTALGLPE